MIGENIKRMRENAGLTQAELAHKLGVGQSIIAQYEAGGKVPNAYMLKCIAQIFGVTTDSMYE